MIEHDNGKVKKITIPIMVKALSSEEALTKAHTYMSNGSVLNSFEIVSVTKTNIQDIIVN